MTNNDGIEKMSAVISRMEASRSKYNFAKDSFKFEFAQHSSQWAPLLRKDNVKGGKIGCQDGYSESCLIFFPLISVGDSIPRCRSVARKAKRNQVCP